MAVTGCLLTPLRHDFDWPHGTPSSTGLVSATPAKIGDGRWSLVAGRAALPDAETGSLNHRHASSSWATQRDPEPNFFMLRTFFPFDLRTSIFLFATSTLFTEPQTRPGSLFFFDPFSCTSVQCLFRSLRQEKTVRGASTFTVPLLTPPSPHLPQPQPQRPLFCFILHLQA